MQLSKNKKTHKCPGCTVHCKGGGEGGILDKVCPHSKLHVPEFTACLSVCQADGKSVCERVRE
jgi:hypothetical protein